MMEVPNLSGWPQECHTGLSYYLFIYLFIFFFLISHSSFLYIGQCFHERNLLGYVGMLDHLGVWASESEYAFMYARARGPIIFRSGFIFGAWVCLQYESSWNVMLFLQMKQECK